MTEGKVSLPTEMSTSKRFHPGKKILYKDKEKQKYDYATFSGKIYSFGVTVGHLVSGSSLEIRDRNDEQVIAIVDGKIDGTVIRNDEEYTADISFMKMFSCCTVKNKLRWIDGETTKEFRLKLYKDYISAGQAVMVLNEDGFMKKGTIENALFNCKSEDTGKEVINGIRIVGENNQVIAEEGQSGALVTSCPKPESDVLSVYGIVTHIHEKENNCSATIANRLWDVLRIVHENGSYKLGETLESIDFAND